MKRTSVVLALLSALTYQCPAHAVRMVEATLSISHELSGPSTIKAGDAASFSDLVTFNYTPPALIADPSSPNVTFTSIEFMSPVGQHELRLLTGRESDTESPVSFYFQTPQPTTFFDRFSYSYAFSFDPIIYDAPGVYTLGVDARQLWASMSYSIAGLSNWRGDYQSDSGYSIENSSNQLTLSVSPVPEPETYSMLLAGLLFLSVASIARRQKTRVSSVSV